MAFIVCIFAFFQAIKKYSQTQATNTMQMLRGSDGNCSNANQKVFDI
jgi:hypothetical protein